MRIIAGDYKGRKLNTPTDDHVRPTTEKVKEALFSIIAPQIREAVVCDLFAGTGNLGLEALSRGAKKCYFSDNAGESIKLIKDNIAACKAEEYCTVMHGDYRKNLSRIDEQIDIFLIDPPYKKDLWEDCMELIAELDLLAPDGIIVVEHNKEKEIPDEILGYTKIKEKHYSRVVLSIFM